jgi:hypothetical protein
MPVIATVQVSTSDRQTITRPHLYILPPVSLLMASKVALMICRCAGLCPGSVSGSSLASCSHLGGGQQQQAATQHGLCSECWEKERYRRKGLYDSAGSAVVILPRADSRYQLCGSKLQQLRCRAHPVVCVLAAACGGVYDIPRFSHHGHPELRQPHRSMRAELWSGPWPS